MLDSKSLSVLENGICVLTAHVDTTIASVVNEEKRFFSFSCSFIESFAENLLRLSQFAYRRIDRLCDVREFKVFTEDVSKLTNPLCCWIDIYNWHLVFWGLTSIFC